MDDEGLMTCDEVAALVHRSRRTVQRWAEAGLLPIVHKLPGATGAYLFRRADVEALLEQLGEAS